MNVKFQNVKMSKNADEGSFFYGHKDKNEKELDMRKNRKRITLIPIGKRICIMAVLLAGSLMLGGVQ